MWKALLVWRRNGLTRSFAAKETKDEELTEAGSDVAEQVTGDGRRSRWRASVGWAGCCCPSVWPDCRSSCSSCGD